MSEDLKKTFMPKQGTQSLGYVADSEPWCQYTLEDGSVVRVRVMVTSVLFGGLDPNGAPIYQLKMQQVTDVRHGPTYTVKEG